MSQDESNVVIDQEAFVAEMHAQYLGDPEEHLPGMRSDLEPLPDGCCDALTSFMRHCHSLKGGAQMVGFAGLATLLHEMETQAAGLRDREIPEAELGHGCDLLRSCFVELESYMQLLKNAGPNEDPYCDRWRPTISSMASWLAAYPERAATGPAPAESPNTADSADPWGLKEMETTSPQVAPAPESVDAPAVAADSAPGFGFFDEPAAAPAAESAGFGIFDDADSSTAAFGFFDDVDPTAAPSPATGAASGPVLHGAQAASTTMSGVVGAVDYLLCENDGQHYAIPVGLVREVIASVPLADVPRAPEAVGGIIRLRDEFVPVIKRATVFGDRHGATKVAIRECIIVCEMGTKKFGIQVEKVHQVLACSKADMQKLNNVGGKRGGMIADIGTIDGHSVLFIDLGRLELG